MKVSWDSLNEAVAQCQRCELCRQIHHKVPGQGNAKARLMLIGEGPGYEEDKSGLAFVGPAGQLLTKMLASIQLTREEVYICNVVKCRPPANRVPTPDEMAACMGYLRMQFALVRPQVILLLGATAGRAVLGESFRVTRDRGRFVIKNGVWMMPTYHPSALLRDETGQKKREAWQDLLAVKAKLAEVPAGESRRVSYGVCDQ